MARTYTTTPEPRYVERAKSAEHTSDIVANPTLAGTESALTGLQVGTTKYKVKQPINVVANPVLTGTEASLSSLQVGDTKYKVDVTYRKTEMDDTAEVNTAYDLGLQSTLSIVLPATASSLDEIYIAFESGSTATTLTITGTYLGDTSYSPLANCICELSFKYICDNWVLIVKETATT